MMKAYFLEAAVPLTKTFKIENGELKKEGHPRIMNYTSHEVEWQTIEDLYKAVVDHANAGHCLLKGQLTRPLSDEPRGGSTDPNTKTRIICLDMDGVKDITRVDELLKLMGMGDVDYIVQFSSSMGVVPDRGLSAHVFIITDREIMPSVMKQWLIGENLRIDVLRRNIGLTRTNNALRWTLDITTCQNDKLIYITPPVLGPGVKDGFKGDRIQLVKRKKRVFPFPDKVPTAEANKVAANAVLNELREKDGLPRRKAAVFKHHGSIEYMHKPDQAIVTGIKQERGFVYLNLNGGDSWAYYHPENNPEFIYNFKGDPVYKTSELLPEYWAEVKATINTPQYDSSGTLHLAFRDFKTAMYWNGTWNRDTKELRIAVAKSADQLRHFLKQQGQPVGDFIPDWDVVFEPNSDFVVDPSGKRINKFQPTRYMEMPKKKVMKVPPLVERVILHACGSDKEAYEHMLNWLAVIIKYRCRTETAWVLHGVPGTGKGLFLNKILRPLFRYVVSKRTRELDSQFNGFLEECLLFWIDEAEIALQPGASLMEADLKNYIVEPIVSIRKMHQVAYETDNHMNVILSSNKGEVITIDPKDRRFNVAPFQNEALVITQDEVDSIAYELEDFASYLMGRKADRDTARTPMNNAAKKAMVHITQNSIDLMCNAILSGDLATLWDQRPSNHLQTGNTNRDILAGAYIRLMEMIATGKRTSLSREDIQVIMEYTLGNMPMSPYKFTSLLKHHRVILEPVSIDGKTVRGLKVNWRIPDNIREELKCQPK